MTQHEDILGQPLVSGAYVAVSHNNTLIICKIIKITSKMVRVVPVKAHWKESFLKYPIDVLALTGTDLLAYVLKHQKK